MRFHLLSAALLASLLTLSAPSYANDSNYTDTAEPIVHALVRPGLRVEVEDTSTGVLAPLMRERGYRVAQLIQGMPYALHLTNITAERVLVVVSLNGRDPFTGKKAYRGQKGHVIEPGATLTVNEYRQDKNTTRPLFENQPPQANLDVAVFYERTDYPLILPGMDTPPYGPENFVVSASGKKRWLPPEGYPFRKRKEDPSSLVHLPYTIGPGEGGAAASISAP